MATLDSLEPQSRAIVELLLRQGKGYDELAEMLDIPTPRVRELAREALTSLAPASARRVDGDWRDQLADYVLGQQTGPEVRATRGHLKRSEAARAWVASLVDSLDPLYGDGDRPEIPEPGSQASSERPRRRGGRAARGAGAGAAAAGAGAAAGAASGQRDKPWDTPIEDEAPVEPVAEEAAAAPAEKHATTEPADPGAETTPQLADEQATRASTPAVPARSGGGARTGGLSPEAHAIVRRRRLIGGAIAAATLLAAIVLAIVLLSGGSDKKDQTPRRGGNGAAQGQGAAEPGGQARLVGQATMRPVGGGGARGAAVIAARGGQFQLLVQARGLKPSARNSAYEVWLYNSPSDAASLGGQVTDDRGNLQGAGPLPQNFRQYRFIDISRERLDRNPKHSGDSVLRVAIADVLRGAAAAKSGAGGAAGGAQP